MTTPCRITVRIAVDDFDVGAEMRALYDRCGGAVGAVASFTGLVRDRAGDETVSALHLEHYPGMTERSIEKIVEEASERWPLLDVVVVHRVGSLGAREQIVYVQVASGHRAAAFAGAEFIMDYLKTDAVLWKRETGSTADRWIEATAVDRQRRN
ncbi:MAG: molybdenum cofactor biosynthesis protein MoaE, partial [Gammaproteobacteria bacterium]